jgi:hypothetical protein
MPTSIKDSQHLAARARQENSGCHQERTVKELTVLTDRGALQCTLTEPLASRCLTDGVDGLLLLVHAAPFGDSASPPMAGLAESLSVATVRVDLTGCGRSFSEGQQPLGNSIDRGAYATLQPRASLCPCC